ncbi:hypothetical protein Scep_021790 [Stephania cephalantha]|uniref:Uncharacterized protein n=1 Tax=Stephania cephalantha TaxID=152367 RepID=A0AAP0F438_9MAGN
MVFTTRGSPPRPCKPISSKTPKIPAAAPSPKIRRHHRSRRRPLPSLTSTATRRLIRSSATPVDRESPRAPARSSLLDGAAAAARYSPPAPLAVFSSDAAVRRRRCPFFRTAATAPFFGSAAAYQQSSRPVIRPLRDPTADAGRLRVRPPPPFSDPAPPPPAAWSPPRSSVASGRPRLRRRRCSASTHPQPLVALGSSLNEFRVSSATRGLPLG